MSNGNVWPGDRIPRSVAEVDEVCAKRPPLWEYLYFYGSLCVEKQQLEPRYSDFKMGYARSANRVVQGTEAVTDLGEFLNEGLRLARTLSELMSEKTQEWAFGPKGVPGDPEHLKQLAHRWMSVYGDMLSAVEKIRGTTYDSRFSHLAELTIKMLAGPIREYRQFLDDMIAKADLIPAAVATHQSPIDISGELHLSFEDGALEEYEAELDRLK